MDTQQFEHLINLLAERLPPSAPSPAEPTTPTHPLTELVREQRVSWAQLPRLDLACASELDTWFISFEARMKAARVAEENWPARLLECPMVEESTKVHVRELEPFTYAALRQLILKEHGPVDPINFFKREMYRVRGDKREDVREMLMHILIKHNRAARAAGIQEMQDRDLCYPFIDAFPVDVRKALEQKLALVFAQEEPFEHVFRLAPSKQDADQVLVADTRDALDSNTRRQEIEDAVALAIQAATQNFSQPPWKRRLNSLTRPGTAKFVRGTPTGTFGYRCAGCGSDACQDRQHCPARTAVCFGCNKVGHFRKVCRGAQKPPFQNGPRSQ